MSENNKNQIEPKIASRIMELSRKISAAASKAGRNNEEVSLMAVSKFHPVAKIRSALECGHRLFGENRVQEATSKYPNLK